jgi:exonuclease III
METFSMQESSTQGYYTYQTLATKGTTGRPSGGIARLIKPGLATAKQMHKNANVIVVDTKTLTIVGCYFQPDQSAQDIVEAIGEALQKVDHNKAIILAGDLNCRIDRSNIKTDLILNYLAEEGFTVTNKANEKTYICHNGSSTIDLIFHNAHLATTCAKVISYTSTASLRKHLPVMAKLKMHCSDTNKTNITNRVKRQLNINLFKEM